VALSEREKIALCEELARYKREALNSGRLPIVREWCFYDSINERESTSSARGKRAVVATSCVACGLVLALLFGGGGKFYSGWVGSGSSHCLVRLNFPLKSAVLFPQGLHFVRVPLLIFCKFLLHSGLSL